MKQAGSWSPITGYGNTAATKYCFTLFHKKIDYFWKKNKQKKKQGEGDGTVNTEFTGVSNG